MIDRRVTLLGYELVPTLEAMKKINRRFEDLVSVARRVTKADFDAVSFVAAAGANVTGKAVDQLEQDIFEHGVVNCIGPVSEYLSLLMDPHGAEDEKPGKD